MNIFYIFLSFLFSNSIDCWVFWFFQWVCSRFYCLYALWDHALWSIFYFFYFLVKLFDHPFYFYSWVISSQEGEPADILRSQHIFNLILNTRVISLIFFLQTIYIIDIIPKIMFMDMLVKILSIFLHLC